MATLHDEMTIHASPEALWRILTGLELLAAYDPTVKTATLLSTQETGLGAARRVTMRDGKNWFEEKIVVFEPNQALAYQLTDCSFPIQGLRHSYTFEQIGNQTKVRQVMAYTVKFGWLGRLLDRLMIRKQTDSGVKKFFAGLKEYAESH
jgi:uncharacterized protein YndB with AHSA1/START domain